MGQKDKTEKLLEDYNDVFADIFNVLVFKDQTLKEERLLAGPTESVYKAATGTYSSQYRDIGKYYLDAGKNQIPMRIAEFGVENQSTYDKYIAFRIMSYDSASYRRQIDNETNMIAPVISIVLNFSDAIYSDTMGLKEFMGMSLVADSLDDYDEYGDYRVRCYNIAYLEDDVIERFKSDFKSVAYYFKNKRLYGEDFNPNKDEIKHIEAFVDLISTFTNDKRYKETAKVLKQKQQNGQVITMCEVLDSYINRGIKIGISQGISRGISQATNLAIQRLIDAEQSEEFILSLGYTLEEIACAKNGIK